MDAKKLTTLGLVIRREKILLIHRKKEPNLGLYTPPGGKIRLKESPEECVFREVEEETGLRPVDPRLRGIITQVAPVRGQQWMLFVYRIEDFKGRLRPSHREGDARWFPITDVTSGKVPIPEADRIFLPRLLGRRAGVITMKFHHRRDLSVLRWE